MRHLSKPFLDRNFSGWKQLIASVLMFASNKTNKQRWKDVWCWLKQLRLLYFTFTGVVYFNLIFYLYFIFFSRTKTHRARHFNNPQPIHSCIHTLIPAASRQDVASIQQQNHTVTCRFDLICCFRLCLGFPTILHSHVLIVLTTDTLKMWSCGSWGATVLLLRCFTWASFLMHKPFFF